METVETSYEVLGENLHFEAMQRCQKSIQLPLVHEQV